MPTKKLVKEKKPPKPTTLRIPVDKRLTAKEFSRVVKWNNDGSVACVIEADMSKFKNFGRPVGRSAFLSSLCAGEDEDRDNELCALFESIVEHGVTLDCCGRHRYLNNNKNTNPRFTLLKLDGNIATFRADIPFEAVECWLFVLTKVEISRKLALKLLTEKQRNSVVEIATVYLDSVLSPSVYEFDGWLNEEQIEATAHKLFDCLFDDFSLPYVSAAWYNTRRKLAINRKELAASKKATEEANAQDNAKK